MKSNRSDDWSALTAALAALDAASSVLMSRFSDGLQGLGRWEKAPGALVTEADIESDQMIAKTLADSGAIGKILSEESVSHLGPEYDHGDRTWLIDPLCGTVPFSAGMNHWGINLAMRRGSRLSVAAMSTPTSGETLSAIRDEGVWMNGEPLIKEAPSFKLSQSVIGLEIDGGEDWRRLLKKGGLRWLAHVGQTNMFSSAAYPMMQVCLGRMAGVVFYNIEPMHLAAGSLIAQESGVAVSDGRGDSIDWSADAALPIVAAAWPSVHGELIAKLASGDS